MNLDSVPIGALFAITIAFVMLSIEAGYQWGKIAHRRLKDEKETPASTVAATVLGLLAFMLTFTFGIVWNRYDDRKELVREEANAIRTAVMRSEFLPEPDRSRARQLLRHYVDARVAAVEPATFRSDHLQAPMKDAARIQRRLWDMAVVNARRDMNSDVAALYIESLNEVAAMHASRITVGLHARVPLGIWLVLYSLTLFAMMSIGYQTGIVSSRRPLSTLLLATSFALVIAVIATLDRPAGFIGVSQRPLVDLRDEIVAGQ